MWNSIRMKWLSQRPWLLQRNNNFIKGGRARMLPSFFISINPRSQLFYISTSELQKENSSLNSYWVNVCGPLEVQLHWERERERESAESVFCFMASIEPWVYLLSLCLLAPLSRTSFFTKTKKILIISLKNFRQNINININVTVNCWHQCLCMIYINVYYISSSQTV